MNKEVEFIKEDVEAVKQSHNNAYELAIHTMEQNYKREKFITKVLLVIILVLLAINAYFAYVFTTTTVVETTEEWAQDGTYNIYNKDGSMTNGDIPYGEADLQENN